MPRAIRALEYPAAGGAASAVYPRNRIEGGRRLGVDGQSPHEDIVGEAGGHGAPTPTTIRALEYAAAYPPRGEGRRLGGGRRGGDEEESRHHNGRRAGNA